MDDGADCIKRRSIIFFINFPERPPDLRSSPVNELRGLCRDLARNRYRPIAGATMKIEKQISTSDEAPCLVPEQRQGVLAEASSVRELKAASHAPAWAALIFAVLAHVAGLAYLSYSKPITFSLESKGRPVSASGIEATLITKPSEPAPPTPPEPPTPLPPSVPEPSKVVKPVEKAPPAKVLTSKDSKSKQTVAPPKAPAIAPMPPASAVPTQAAPVVPKVVPSAVLPEAAASHVSPTLNIEGTQAREVRQLNCSIPVPRYPARAKSLGQVGTTVMRVVIGTDGAINKAIIITSSGYPELDNSARAAVLKATCKAYIENGHAIAVTAMQPISFNLK